MSHLVSEAGNTALKQVDRAVRWEGNNLPDICEFLGKLPVRIEVYKGDLIIRVYASEKITLPDNGVALELLLRHGDGLMWDGEMLGVARNMVWEHEKPKDDSKLH